MRRFCRSRRKRTGRSTSIASDCSLATLGRGLRRGSLRTLGFVRESEPGTRRGDTSAVPFSALPMTPCVAQGDARESPAPLGVIGVVRNPWRVGVTRSANRTDARRVTWVIHCEAQEYFREETDETPLKPGARTMWAESPWGNAVTGPGLPDGVTWFRKLSRPGGKYVGMIPRHRKGGV
jgi:hypothetical protein